MAELEGRFRIIRSLGTGAGGETFEAESVHDGSRVALKRLVLATTDDWKKVDLFQREARVLASLEHPAIPRYRDSFVEETPQGPVSYLAHDFAPGQSLRAWVESGWRADEAEIVRVGAFLLDVLAYLHALHPPVIHRDIKPANVIRSEDGRLWLVDFGAVRDSVTTMAGSSTVVGTYGYMAPEQFRGHAVAGSDIYGVGATLLYLLGGKPPTEYPQDKLKISFRGAVRVSPFLARWLDRALEPAPEDRFPDAREALAVLRGEKRAATTTPKKTSGKRAAILATMLGVLVIGAGGVVGVSKYREAAERTANRTATLATRAETVARLPDRLHGAPIANDARIFDGRHTHIVFSLALSRDEKTLASASDAVIKLWNTETAKETRSIGAHGAQVGALHFFSDGKRLLSAGGRTLKIWDYEIGKELQSFDLGSVVQELAVSRDEKIAYFGGMDGVVHVWDFAKSAETTTFPFGQHIYALATSPDGSKLVVGGKSGLVRVYTLPEGRRIAEWEAHRSTVNDLVFSPDGSMIASAGDDTRAVVTSLDSRGTARFDSEYRSADETWGVAFSPDGKVLATMSKDRNVSFITLATRHKQQVSPIGAWAEKGLFSKDGDRFFNAGGAMVLSWTIARRGVGTPFPVPGADAPGERKARDEDHARYIAIHHLIDSGPDFDDTLVATKIAEAATANPKSPYPSIASAYREMTRAYVQGDTYDPKGVAAARADLVRVESLGQKTVEWWTMKAYVERISKDAPAAREALRQAFRISPKDPTATLSEARLDLREGKVRPAVAALSELVRSTRDDGFLRAAYGELAKAYYQLGDIDAADRAHNELVARAPSSAWVRGNYASFLNAIGEPEKAIELAKAALAIMDYPHARSSLGRAHALLGDRALWEQQNEEVALREYNEAITLGPMLAEPYYGRAAIYRARAFDAPSGKRAESLAKARADLKKALSLQSSLPEATRALQELEAVEAIKTPGTKR